MGSRCVGQQTLNRYGSRSQRVKPKRAYTLLRLLFDNSGVRHSKVLAGDPRGLQETTGSENGTVFGELDGCKTLM